MSVMDFMRCSFITDKDQLIHLSGSLINGQNDQGMPKTGFIKLQTYSMLTYDVLFFRSTYDMQKENSEPLNIGINNVFEVGSEVHAKSIGDHNVFESECK
jgi:hypothetical protein